MKDLDIFIGTHKDFTKKVNDESYKVIVGNHKLSTVTDYIDCKHNELLDDKFFSEIYMLSWIAKNVELKKYVGFCHYRRYFSFMDKIPNMDAIFSLYDVVMGKKLRFLNTIEKQYALCHNVDDLMIVRGIIKDKYEDYLETFDNFMKSKTMYPYNMFIMKKEDFLEYMDFIKGVLDEYVSIVGTDIEKRISENKEKYLKNFYPSSTEEYQYRIGGYLAERLTNVFVLKKFNNILTYPIKKTENVYPIESRLNKLRSNPL